MPELTRRYVVMSMATEGPFDLRDPDAPFVLKPWKDPAALRALETYRDHCYPELARELAEWITVVSSGQAPRGGVGLRNDRHMASRPATKSSGKAKRAATPARAKRQARPAKRSKPKRKARK